jgi:hypothetical protein
MVALGKSSAANSQTKPQVQVSREPKEQKMAFRWYLVAVIVGGLPDAASLQKQ